MNGYEEERPEYRGVMHLEGGEPQYADGVLWNLSGEDARDALGAYLKSDDRIVYQILVREVVR